MVEKLIEENEYGRKRGGFGPSTSCFDLLCNGEFEQGFAFFFFYFLILAMTNCLMNESCAIRNCIVDVFLFFD